MSGAEEAASPEEQEAAQGWVPFGDQLREGGSSHGMASSPCWEYAVRRFDMNPLSAEDRLNEMAGDGWRLAFVSGEYFVFERPWRPEG